MNSRERILKEINANKPAAIALPQELLFFQNKNAETTSHFINTLTNIGGSCKPVESLHEISAFILQQAGNNIPFIQGIKEFEGYNIDQYEFKTAAELKDVNTVLIAGTLAVAENGAVWVPERNMVNRLLPFICHHLMIVIKEENIVPTMHDAYARIKIEEADYGVFIAGPSKTADIEQSLVLGAHGPLSLQVFLLKERT